MPLDLKIRGPNCSDRLLTMLSRQFGPSRVSQGVGFQMGGKNACVLCSQSDLYPWINLNNICILTLLVSG